MTAALLWLEAARPKTLILSVTPVIIGTSYAYYQGAFSHHSLADDTYHRALHPNRNQFCQ